jgi:hypothetical protein
MGARNKRSVSLSLLSGVLIRSFLFPREEKGCFTAIIKRYKSIFFCLVVLCDVAF